MAELEINKEDVHDNKRTIIQNLNLILEKECYEEEVQPYRKTNYKAILIIYLCLCVCI